MSLRSTYQQFHCEALLLGYRLIQVSYDIFFGRRTRRIPRPKIH